MEDLIINGYLNDNLSVEKLALKYGMGKIKIKQILSDNSIELKKRGGQQKHHTIPFKYDLTNKIVECKHCLKKYNDVENKSGSLIDHMKTCYPNVIIPTKLFRSNYKNDHGEYWHFQYFNVIDKIENTDVLKCPECVWVTTDLTNKTGSFTKHVSKEHGDLNCFIEKYPECQKFFNVLNLSKLYNEDINQSLNNFIICKICNKKMKVISNTHLKTHGITSHKYKLLYPNQKLTSKKITEIFKQNSIGGNMNYIPTWTSAGETEIMNFIKSFGFEVEKSKNRKLLMGKEIDMIIESKKIGIEFNGLYYHTEKMGKGSTYHLNKTIDCYNLGYSLIHIFEDEWVIKKELVKNKLKHILNISEGKKIGARNVLITPIKSLVKSEFLEKYHIQGNDNSKIHYGAFYDSELVGVMTFNNKRNMTKNNDNEYELSRFCVKENYIVSGLPSKILKRFINDYSPKSIISFADRRWTIDLNNNMYKKLGFELVSILKPNYSYYNSKINKYKRFHKFGFGKNTLKRKYPNLDYNKSEKELMNELGYDRIWDCGLFKYQLLL